VLVFAFVRDYGRDCSVAEFLNLEDSQRDRFGAGGGPTGAFATAHNSAQSVGGRDNRYQSLWAASQIAKLRRSAFSLGFALVRSINYPRDGEV
jgi:hypothetical protein